MARRVSDLNWGIQREKRNADGGSNDAPAAQMGYSDTLLAVETLLSPTASHEETAWQNCGAEAPGFARRANEPHIDEYCE